MATRNPEVEITVNVTTRERTISHREESTRADVQAAWQTIARRVAKDVKALSLPADRPQAGREEKAGA